MKQAEPAEALLESMAALWLAVCTGYAISVMLPALGMQDVAAAVLGGSALAALTVHRILWHMRRDASLEPRFTLQPIEVVEPDDRPGDSSELLLTPEMERLQPELLLTADMERLRTELRGLGARLVPPSAAPHEELLLDDMLPQLEGDARVVQLFQTAGLPTPGELKSRIDRHIEHRRQAPQQQPDASQALYDALADLRRSLA